MRSARGRDWGSRNFTNAQSPQDGADSPKQPRHDWEQEAQSFFDETLRSRNASYRTDRSYQHLFRIKGTAWKIMLRMRLFWLQLASFAAIAALIFSFGMSERCLRRQQDECRAGAEEAACWREFAGRGTRCDEAAAQSWCDSAARCAWRGGGCVDAGWRPGASPACAQQGRVLDLPTWPELEHEDIGGMGWMLTFVLTFHNGQCFKRYWAVYSTLQDVLGCLNDANIFLFSLLAGSPRVAMQVSRYLQAAHILAIAGVDESYQPALRAASAGGARRGTNAQIGERFLMTAGLLTEEEAGRALADAHLGSDSDRPCTVVCLWAARCVDRARRDGLLDSVQQCELLRRISGLRGAAATVFMYKTQSTPFAYYHLLLTVMNAYLLVYSYVTVRSHAATLQNKDAMFSAACAATLAFSFRLSAYFGLFAVSCAMSTPFGNHHTSLPCLQYMRDGVTNWGGVCEDDYDPTEDLGRDEHAFKGWAQQASLWEEALPRHIRRPAHPRPLWRRASAALQLAGLLPPAPPTPSPTPPSSPAGGSSPSPPAAGPAPADAGGGRATGLSRRRFTGIAAADGT